MSANPRAIVTANPDNFTLLSKLLSAPVDVAAKAWELLMKLPTNPVIQQGIANISAVAMHPLGASEQSQQAQPLVQWSTLVDATSPFRLLYALQIVETLTDVSDTDGDCTVYAVEHAPEKPAGESASKETEGMVSSPPL